MPTAQSALESDLVRLLGSDRVLVAEAELKAYDCDAYGIDRRLPEIVVFPKSTEEVSAIVRACVRAEVPYTPRGAGTGLSGGALAAQGGVVVSTKRLTQILEVDEPNRRARVQAGVVNARLSESVRHSGLHFAPDPSSQYVSTVGGNVAENSGGPHTLKYGVTAPHVLGLTLVDEAGEILQLERGPGLDFVSLIVGAEGTLGIVTEVEVRLTPLPERVETALASFPTVKAATTCVSRIVGSGVMPAALEMMDRPVLEALRAAFGLEFPEASQALLLIECDGTDTRASADIQEVVAVCESLGALNVRVAASEAERAQMWLARKKGIGAMGRVAPTLVTHDGVIPRSRLPEMLDLVYEIADRHGLLVANIFHAGDGNLHPVLCFDEREPGSIEQAISAGEEIIRACLALGGSVTGEHGVGVEKINLLAEMFNEADLRLQADAKAILAPRALCNPCKVLPNQKGCVEHRLRWRGAAT